MGIEGRCAKPTGGAMPAQARRDYDTFDAIREFLECVFSNKRVFGGHGAATYARTFTLVRGPSACAYRPAL